MRAVLHILATLMLLPYLALACAFLLLGHAISGGSILSFFDTLLMHASWIVPWGILGAGAAIAIIAILGAFPRLRRFAALCVTILAAGSLVTLLVLDRNPIDIGQLVFLLPCVLALLCGAWLSLTEPARHVPGRPA